MKKIVRELFDTVTETQEAVLRLVREGHEVEVSIRFDMACCPWQVTYLTKPEGANVERQ